MITNQGARQQSARNVTGTDLDPNGDVLSLIVANGHTVNDFNGALKTWIDGSVLGESPPGISGSMQALATAHGFYNWSAMNSLFVPGGPVLADMASISSDNNYLTADGAFFTADAGALTADSSTYTTDRA
jgi:hypothetical protein